ncbi:stage VI sporulation protein D [Paenibacillus rhizosphaerae]|uniref:Stage VI sporulation protein D n=1 Tax=Paenibacillus rhizosphaerae TaxID=297318 RepID=A0A839U2Y4_9BACL|nr:LysM peptidoglycan-binding domain-containing protein [Paenibacillus rhizosphaerae]MBB3131809.1 stage VI sporulation protein D [Paenibacillus rhizosphaerae]
MFDQSYGLRFDIYERIHLNEDVVGIEELEEIELLPHIQVISQDEQASLRGHLLLTGLYRGEGEEEGTQRLEHLIPVEITVPLNRVTSLDDIAVEIENFDVDLLSKRSLNITGVLSLRGIEIQSAESPAWKADEFTVVHAPDEDIPEEAAIFAEEREEEPPAFEEEPVQREFTPQDDPAPVWTAPTPSFAPPQSQIQAEQPEQVQIEAAEAGDSEEAREAAAWEAAWQAAALPPSEPDEAAAPEASESYETAPSTAWESAREPEREAAAPPPQVAGLSALHTDKEPADRTAEPQYPNKWHFEHEEESELLHPETTAIQADEEPEEDIYLNAASKDPFSEPSFPFGAFQDKVQQEEPPEDREMRIALGSKKEPESGEKEAIGFSSILSSSRSIKELEYQQAQEEQQAADAIASAAASEAEDIKWKNLFLGSISEQTPFRKVRLCIVQREETLETIADRYQLTPRELVLYNRLADQTVQEGQVLYIP